MKKLLDLLNEMLHGYSREEQSKLLIAFFKVFQKNRECVSDD